MSLALPPTAINIIPPTPLSSDAADSTPANAAADAAVGCGDDDEMFLRVADDKIESMSQWLHSHSDIFTHISAGFIASFSTHEPCCTG